MRVIAGKAKRIPLVTPPGQDTRPTTDRIKETLFNILQDELYDCRFLDLFAGSGGIGIEALSRGAKSAVFIEREKHALKCIRQNLEKTRLSEQASVIQTDVIAYISRYVEDDPFDIIFADPPYRKGFEERILTALMDSKALGDETLIIIESALDTEPDFIDEDFYEIVRIKDYKSNRHIFLKKQT